MRSFEITNIKGFMNSLFKEEIFDEFESRGIIIDTFTHFEISCSAEQELAPENEQSDPETKKQVFCSWKELKNIVFLIIKGKEKPKKLKILLAANVSLREGLNKNAAALFLNINYVGQNVVLTTGSSQKQFSLDRELETVWDEYVKEYLQKNNFEFV